MAEIALECPHCAAELAGFQFHSEFRIETERQLPVWNTFWACRICRNGIVVKLEDARGFTLPPSQCAGDPRAHAFRVVEVHPKLQKLTAPEHVPQGIAQDFKEGQDNLRRQNWTSAGMMFRKVLQRTTTSLQPDEVNFRRMTLESRINVLAERHLITPTMGELAHIIRLDGNEASHEEDDVFTQCQAVQIRDFTELFLIYAFTLPARVEAFREAADSSQ